MKLIWSRAELHTPGCAVTGAVGPGWRQCLTDSEGRASTEPARGRPPGQ